jgi:hypothetical protein
MTFIVDAITLRLAKIGFRGMGVTKPYKFKWLRDTRATEPYFSTGIGARKMLSINRMSVCVW